MIDAFFWWANTLFLGGLGVYFYRSRLKRVLYHALCAERQHKSELLDHVTGLQQRCIALQNEIDEQELFYARLHEKIFLWKQKISAQQSESEAMLQKTKKYLEEKRQKQRAYDAMHKCTQEIKRDVVAKARENLQRIFHDKQKSNQYIEHVFNVMDKG